MATHLRVLDLFSGIGGFTLALRSIAETVAYCDIDARCRQVLAKRLPYAPIFDDVTRLKGVDVARLRPNMITAGFPCTDISSANPRGQGLKGARSGLFSEIVRLIDELDGSIHVVFLENSSRIVHKGFKTIKRQMRARGFDIRFCITHAFDVGAPHRRKRWYCVCWRSDMVDVSALPKIPLRDLKFPWHKEPNKVEGIVGVPDRKKVGVYVERCGMLGNAIVPQCAMHAWNTLISGDPDSHTKEKREGIQGITMSDGKRTVHRDYLATPTHSTWHHYRSLTDRGIGILSNQLYYNVRQRIAESGADVDKGKYAHKYTANPRYIEWMMGYPQDWTK